MDTEKSKEQKASMLTLDEPIYVIGKSVRVDSEKAGYKNDIADMINSYFSDDVPSSIPGRISPIMRFGILANYDPITKEFDYLMGDKAAAITPEEMPPGLNGYEIPTGVYATIVFSGIDVQTITTTELDSGYKNLDKYINSLEGWEYSDKGEMFEVYRDDKFSVQEWPEMEIWALLKKAAGSAG
ncbi:MAG: hypothetical protein FWG30_05830 [Eubacteriaceae bacterium]|jgi:predicted transcriptional regulator YdeE|nr:hypothetical protein [Eubacteriaceae bacterium]